MFSQLPLSTASRHRVSTKINHGRAAAGETTPTRPKPNEEKAAKRVLHPSPPPGRARLSTPPLPPRGVAATDIVPCRPPAPMPGVDPLGQRLGVGALSPRRPPTTIQAHLHNEAAPCDNSPPPSEALLGVLELLDAQIQIYAREAASALCFTQLRPPNSSPVFRFLVGDVLARLAHLRRGDGVLHSGAAWYGTPGRTATTTRHTATSDMRPRRRRRGEPHLDAVDAPPHARTRVLRSFDQLCTPSRTPRTNVYG